MSHQWPPYGGGGYGPPPFTSPYMSGPPQPMGPPPQPMGDPQLSKQLAETQQQMAQLISLVKTGFQYPSQWKAGVIDWPNRYPMPMVFTQEMTANDGTGYGTTNGVVRCSIQIDISNPTYLTAISFNLYRPDVAGNSGLIGVWLPLGGTRQPFVAVGALNDYTGRDFRWSAKANSNDLLWQTGMRTSDQCNGDDRRGYILPVEQELRRNDTISLEAEPIGPIVGNPAQTFVLEAVLHCYKMLQRE